MNAALAIAVLSQVGQAGAPIAVSVTLDPPIIPFHRQATYTIAVEAPGDVDVKLSQMVGKFGGLDVYGEPEYSVELLDNGKKRIVETYTLDPIFVGVYRIEPASVTVGQGDTITVPSPAIQIRELTAEEDAEASQFVSVEGPVSIPLPWYLRWDVWVATTILGVALVSLVWYLFRRNRTRTQRAAPPLSPWDRAYQRLRDLDAFGWTKSGRYQAYYVELSDILRSYIEARFELHAPERTTPEFLAEAAQSGVLSEEHQRRLATFLRHCDRVKFARYEPDVVEMEKSFTEVLHFVDETTPPPAKPEEQAA